MTFKVDVSSTAQLTDGPLGDLGCVKAEGARTAVLVKGGVEVGVADSGF